MLDSAFLKRCSSFVWLGIIVVTQTGLLVYGTIWHSPVFDEWWHLPSGMIAWVENRHDLYRVNPPLVRMLGALPVVFNASELPVEIPRSAGNFRSEVTAGFQFLYCDRCPIQQWMTVARVTCLPLVILGTYICYRWASDLYGPRSGLAAATLWAFSPTVLGYGQLITPDAHCAALGSGACYLFWRWLKSPTLMATIPAGALLGLALSAKFTWLMLLPLWPMLWLAYRGGAGFRWRSSTRELSQLALITCIGLLLVNAIYAFDGSCRRLDSFDFQSRGFRADGTDVTTDVTAPPRTQSNRFAETLIGNLPTPFPADYVLGVDRLKLEYEKNLWSYLGGKWRQGGWWYYYVYAFAIKEPLGSLGLLALSSLTLFARSSRREWMDELCLLAPAAAIIVGVSSHMGFNHHYRYILPALPCVYIFSAKAFRENVLDSRCYKALAACCLAAAIIAGAVTYPHSMSFFNMFVGGPTQGHWHLSNSNTDWGQDLWFLESWWRTHPEARPLYVEYDNVVGPHLSDVPERRPPADPRTKENAIAQQVGHVGPLPGWYAISVNHLHSHDGEFDYLLEFQPVDRIGYSMNIYHVTLDECNRVRRKLGIAEIESPVGD